MSPLLYLKGRLVPDSKARVSPLNGTALFGEGLFESLPVYGGKPLFLKDHLARLKKGCRFLGWPTIAPAEFKKAIRLFNRENAGEYLIRFSLAQEFTLPVSPRTFSRRSPLLWAFTRPLAHGPKNFWPLLGPVGVSPWTVPPASSLPNDFKWAFYMMTRQAYRQKPRWREMVRVNAEGFAVDGAGSGVLWFDGKRVLLPPADWVGLESVTQARVAALCRKIGIAVERRAWKPGQVLRGGELIFTGSGVGVMGATHLNGKKLPGGHRLVFRLWQYYREWAQNPLDH